MSKKSMIFAYILGDGWIDKNGNCGVGGDAESLLTIAGDIDELYGQGTARKINTRHTSSPKYGIEGVTSSFITKTSFSKKMQSCGMPVGKRSGIDYKIPDWIMDGTDKTKKDFLSGYYAAEGFTPSMQANGKTPRTLTFPFSKDIELLESSRRLANQFKELIESLGLTVTIMEQYVTTDKEKVKQIISIGNSEDDFFEALQMLDLRYCVKKEERRQQLVTYFTMKRAERDRILSIHQAIKQERITTGATYKELAEKYSLSWRQVEKIMNGRSHAKQVRGFPKFNQKFIETYCLSKTPLNDETPSVNER